MKHSLITSLILLVSIVSYGQNADKKATASDIEVKINSDLPTVGIIIFNDVIMTEVTAPIDVFSKPSREWKKLFNVVTVAKTLDPVTTESKLKIVPDFTFANCPKLDVLVVPSSFNMPMLTKDASIVNFIKTQNVNTNFTMSVCSGAQLIGEAGIADEKKIVTYIGGGKGLQKLYPNLLVQNDSLVSYVEDGKFLSSNGNLASYISSLKLLEKLTSKEQRKFVEGYLYLERLRNWKE
jgi:transcriptional regulator GlxA family with amidase domain